MRSLVLVAAVAISSVPLFAQDSSVKPPPVKMGLWEKTVEMTTVNGTSTTNTTRSCVTNTTWQRMVNNMQKQRDNCKVDQSKSGDGYTFNATCTMPRGGTLVISGNAKVDDTEHISSDTRSTMTLNGQKFVTRIHGTSRFVGASCGAVKPEESER